MNMQKLIILGCSVLVVFSLLVLPVRGYGTESGGGQVITGGKIVFYDEKGSPSETIPPTPDTPSEPDIEFVKKPIGTLPSTGEWSGNIGFIGLFLLLFLVLLFLIRRWTKEGSR